MINFYRKFIPKAAKDQAILNDVLKRPETKGKIPIAWTTELEEAFSKCKKNLSQATILAHLEPDALITLTTDASDKEICCYPTTN